MRIDLERGNRRPFMLQRVVFPFIDRSQEPEDAEGQPNPAAVEAIRRNIEYLHERLLGEHVSPQELEATYQLFLETWREGKAAMAEGSQGRELFYGCQADRDLQTNELLPAENQVVEDLSYAVRAWQVVVTYLLADWAFLHE